MIRSKTIYGGAVILLALLAFAGIALADPVDTDNTVYITNEADFQKLINDMNSLTSDSNADKSFLEKDYILETDIDMTHIADFTPVGFSKYPFTGTFDGQNHTVSNLIYDAGSGSYTGLFGFVRGAEIKNLVLTDFDIMGNDYIGALAGSTGGTVITNCHVKDSQLYGQDTVGGLIGTVFDNSSVQAPRIYDSDDYLIGTYYLTSSAVTDCVSDNVSVSSPSGAGGLIGTVGGDVYFDTVNNSYDILEPRVTGCAVINASVMGNIGSGGLTGAASYTTFENNKIRGGQVQGVMSVGGLVGSAWSIKISDSEVGPLSGSPLTVRGVNGENIFRQSMISGVGGLVGGLLNLDQDHNQVDSGYTYEIIIENCRVEADVRAVSSYSSSGRTLNVSGIGGFIGGAVTFSGMPCTVDFSAVAEHAPDFFEKLDDPTEHVLGDFLTSSVNVTIRDNHFKGNVSFEKGNDPSVPKNNITGIGGFSGYALFKNVSNCSAEGTLKVDTSDSISVLGVGGFSGDMRISSALNCSADVDVEVSPLNPSSVPTKFVGGVGGFSGLILGTLLQDSFSEGNVTVTTVHDNSGNDSVKKLVNGAIVTPMAVKMTQLKTAIQRYEQMDTSGWSVEEVAEHRNKIDEGKKYLAELNNTSALYKSLDFSSIPQNSVGVGGMSGLSLVSGIRNSYTSGNVAVKGDAAAGTGGLVGLSIFEILDGNYVSGDTSVTGNNGSGAGGMVGLSVLEVIRNSYVTGDVEMNGTVDAGSASGGLGGTGGLVGCLFLPADAGDWFASNGKSGLDYLVENSFALNEFVSGTYNTSRVIGTAAAVPNGLANTIASEEVYAWNNITNKLSLDAAQTIDSVSGFTGGINTVYGKNITSVQVWNKMNWLSADGSGLRMNDFWDFMLPVFDWQDGQFQADASHLRPRFPSGSGGGTGNGTAVDTSHPGADAEEDDSGFEGAPPAAAVTAVLLFMIAVACWCYRNFDESDKDR